eukprot:CAMPEP_0113462388 /NCGR_PEP_ID=MMETSP0014_2-20120614/12062_1 /TAXON_ID=2857 /ORGANISM="Nitzschia sp." /LENGTH=138 /DNA_ID=CAMNT_0000354241 /DNA_START=169 /DNA_END=585 /DNA_ORIENTATION=+ /assembly_acc=CAM_ASM_000159
MNNSSCEAYTTRQPGTQKKVWTMITPSTTTSSSQQPTSMNADGWQLSQSVDASADNTFGTTAASRRRRSSSSTPRAAHGILSPETVARMDEMTAGGASNEAVRDFLRTYRRQGPMSCLEMLSDPDVLPHLTKAMRDII